jgi:hypothetical protein
MRQIADSATTHQNGAGHTPTQAQMDEILGIRG